MTAYDRYSGGSGLDDQGEDQGSTYEPKKC
jgi:hypothetical protein